MRCWNRRITSGPSPSAMRSTAANADDSIKMVVFPNCKINLGLHVVRKRDDGYHDLETVFYPLPLRDALEVVRAEGRGQKAEMEKEVTIHLSGLPVQGRDE